MRTVVVLPTYNESGNIVDALTAIRRALPGCDVLVVDDSSPDGTGGLAKEFAGRTGMPVRVLTRPCKQGLGAAYRAGFADAFEHGYNVVVQMDADGSHPFEILPQMVGLVESGADLVLGSRYCRSGRRGDGWPWYRRGLSRFGNAYARGLLRARVHDLTGGYKAWSAATLRRIDVGRIAGAAGYAFQIQTTIDAVDAGARVVEVPIVFRPRVWGDSKMSGRIVAEAAVEVLRLRRHRPMRRAAARV